MADYGVDLLIEGVWTPVSTLESDGVTIAGGRQKDAGESDPLTIDCTFVNQDGELSPRNVRSSNFGKVGQGSPLRVTRPAETHLWLPEAQSGATTPDTAALDIVGDIDVRIDLQLASWQGNFGIPLGGKYVTTGDQRSWVAYINDDGYPLFRWSSDGLFGANSHTITWTERPPRDAVGRVTIRFTLDVSDGFSWTARAYWSHGGVNSSSWTQLAGAAQAIAPGATSIFSSTASLRIGYSNLTAGNAAIRLHAAQVRSGIGGTVVANPDFSAATPGAANLVDSTGKTWTPFGTGAEFRDVDVRGAVELQRWPSRWTVDEAFKWAEVQGRGLSARLNRPGTELRDPIFLEATAVDNLVNLLEYWPVTDGGSSTQVASGLSGGPTMQAFGDPQFASNTRIPGSDPMIGLATGVTLVGAVRSYAATGVVSYRGVFDIPLTGWTDEAAVVEIAMSGGTGKWARMHITDIGQLRWNTYASNGALIGGSGTNWNFDMLGKRGLIGFNFVQNGANVDYTSLVRYVNDDLSVTALAANGTLTGVTLGKMQQVTIAPQGDLDGGGVGHIMVGNATSLSDDFDPAIVGNNGETAGDRLIRLGRKLGVPIRIYGRSRESSAMGPQPSGRPWTLFQECADTDGGDLFDARDRLGLDYRTRGSLYNGPEVAIMYDDPGQSPDLQPDEPGEGVTNTYVAKRPNGSEYVAEQTTGPLSTQPFPNGVGPLPGGQDYNVTVDSDLFGAAWWAIHISTWDEYRFPRVKFNLRKLQVAGNDSLIERITDSLPGDRFVISNPPGDLPPWPLDLIGQGWTEFMKQDVWDYETNCTPGRPWAVGTAGETPADSDYSELDDPIDADDTVFDVAVEGTPWAEDAAYPLAAVFMREGREFERFTVLDISGLTSPQTWTVERAIDDDWSTSHPAGTEIRLWAPVRMAR